MLYFYFLQWSNSKNTQARRFYKGWRGLKDSKISNLSLATSRQQPKSWCLWAELPHKVMNLDLQFVSEEFPSHFPCPPLKRPKHVAKAHTLDWQTGWTKDTNFGNLGSFRAGMGAPPWLLPLHQGHWVAPYVESFSSHFPCLRRPLDWMHQLCPKRDQTHNLSVSRKGVKE